MKIDDQNIQITDLINNAEKNMKKIDGNQKPYISPVVAEHLKIPEILKQRGQQFNKIRNQMNINNGQKIPPNFQKSENHRKANKVGPEKDINEMKEDETIEYCDCCARQIQRQQLGLKCDIYEFSFLGSGYPLYFLFQKQCVMVLLLVLSFSGIFNIITNIIESQSCDTEKNGEKIDNNNSNSQQNNYNNSTDNDTICRQSSGFNLFSLGEKSQQNTFMEIQGYLNLASLVVMIFQLQFFRKTQRKLDIKCDDEDISANDYTIIVENIPKEIDALNDDYDEDLKEHFKLNSLNGKQSQIESVTLCYNIEEVTKLEKQKQNIIQDKKKCMNSINNIAKKMYELQYKVIEKGNEEVKIKTLKDMQQSFESSQAIKTLNDIKQSQELSGMHPQQNDIYKQKNCDGRDHMKQRLSIFAQVQTSLNKQNSLKNNQQFHKIMVDNKSQEQYIEKNSQNNIICASNKDQQKHINNSPDRLIKEDTISNGIFFNTEKKLFNQDEVTTKQTDINQSKVNIKTNQKKSDQLTKLKEQLLQEQLKLKEIHMFIDKIDGQLQSLKEKLMDGKGKEFMQKYFTGIAFVCLKYEQDKEEIIERYRTIGFYDKLISKKSSVSYSMVYHNSKLKIQQAPDPTNVNWENLHYTKKQKLIRRIIGFLITIIVLFGCAMALYAFHKFQVDQVNNGADSTRLQLVSFSLAVTISILNFLLGIILQLISAFCKYSTRTKVNAFVAKGLSIANFINSALISFIIQIFVTSKNKQKTLFGDGGIAENANYFMISNCFVPALAQLINVEYYVLEFLRKVEIKKGLYSLKTQQELNQLYENPPFPIEERYAQLLMTMFTTAFYCPIVPITLVWSIIGLTLQYWIDKISTLIFYQYANGGNWGISSIIGTFVGLLHAFLPMQLINERIFEVEKAEANTIDYEEAQKYFITDYNRENPIYKQHARQSHVKKMNMKVSHQKTFLRLNTLKSQESENSGNGHNFTNKIQNENKSIFHNHSPVQSEYYKQMSFPLKSIDLNEKMSEINFDEGKDSNFNHEDDLQNTKSPQQLEQIQQISPFQQNANELNQKSEEEVLKFEKQNIFTFMQSQLVHNHLHPAQTQSIHNNEKLIHNNEENKQISQRKKIEMNKLNQKENEIECTDAQPYSVILLTSNDQEENYFVQKEKINQKKKNYSCDFLSQQILSEKSQKINYHQDKRQNVKQKQNRKQQQICEQNIILNTYETNRNSYSSPNINQPLPTSE